MNKKQKKCLVIIIILLFLLVGILLVKSILDNSKADKNHSDTSTFKTFTDTIFSELITDSITLNYMLSSPENYNITSDPYSFGSVSLDDFDKHYNYIEEKLLQLKTFNYNKLSDKEKIVYDTLKWNFELEQKYKNFELYKQILAPDTGISCKLPIILSEYHFYSQKSIDDYLNLLPDIYRYFNDICEYEKLKLQNNLFMSKISADSIINHCKTFTNNTSNNILLTTFNKKIDNFSTLSKNEKEIYKEKNEQLFFEYVIPAYNLLSDTLTELKKTSTHNGALCNYENGKAYYELLVTSNTGTDSSIDEICSLLNQLIISDTTQLFSLISNSPNLYNELLNSTFKYKETTEILEHLKKSIMTDFPNISDMDCIVKQVPKNLSNYMSPAFYLIPPIDNYTDNTIYINPNNNSSNSLFSNLAHEAYPGHLYQNSYFCSKNNYPILHLLSNIGYQEGYASYVTFLSYKYAGLNDNLAKLYTINDSLTLCLSARADIGIHYEGWNVNDLQNYFSQNNFAIDLTIAEELYNIIISNPCNYLTYAVGYAHIINMQNEAKSELQDNFNLKEFHKFILDVGPVPFDIIYKQFYNVYLSDSTH